MYKIGYHSLLPTAIAGLCLALHHQAVAQESQLRQLEEVIATAQKRKQSLKDVAIAITALRRQLLENNVINNE